MKIKELFLKIYLFLLILCIFSLIILSVLGNKNRIGYLGDFVFDEYQINYTLKLNGLLDIKEKFMLDGELDKESIKQFIFTNDSITNYSYGFRIKYYDKIFRNSDIYGVYLDINKILEDNNFIKEIKIDDNGSPFGNLISDKIITEEKIDNVNYILKIKSDIIKYSLILLIISLLFFINYLSDKNKKIIFISYSIVLIFLIVAFIVFYIIGMQKHKGYISDFKLIDKTSLGYVYKAKLYSKSIFYDNFISYISEKPIILQEKPNFIKNYGYSVEIKDKPISYDKDVYIGGDILLAEVHSASNFILAQVYSSSNGNVIYSNSAEQNIFDYNLQTSKGEKYKVDLNIKNINGNGKKIYFALDSVNGYYVIPNTDNISEDYNIYSAVVDIETSSDIYNSRIDFRFPYGEIEVESIKIEQIEDNLYIKDSNDIIITSYNKISKDTYISNAYYYTNVNPHIYLILIIALIILYILYYLNNKEKVDNFINKKVFIFITIALALIIFAFHFWLCFPGYYQIADHIGIMRDVSKGVYSNWHPVILYISLDIFYHLFGYHTFYFTLINLICFYTGISLIIISLYLKFNKKRVILLFLLSFIANIFFFNIDQTKDATASTYIWLAYSMIFFKSLVDIKNKKINIAFYIAIYIVLLLALLWRHNMIVTIYPAFLVLTYLILKNREFQSTIKYLLSYSSIMIIFAVLLILIHTIFPRIFIKDLYPYKKITNFMYIANIVSCSVPANDGSLIPNDWYVEGKTFDDLKEFYTNSYLNHMVADGFYFPHHKTQILKFDDLNNAKKVWIRYILKYPLNYIKHNILFANKLVNWPMWTFTSQAIQEKNTRYEEVNTENYLFTDKGISFSKFREKTYTLLFNIFPNIGSIYFILISALLFLISGILYIVKYKNNLILLITFSSSFSAVATFVIVTLFSPGPISRYFAPIIYVSIISLISFITFVYSIDGLKILYNKILFEKGYI
ncbi:hypothetical protein A9X77_12700 [Brachyspira hyodysenteriae]|uniref:hypothetical protein n=1 Tax=Brachyspira hyodysenteriae TaxID=159 RepID=UPI00063DBE55|nr:hypothetical protein [Brachyspira hyodysenteriae]KLI22717.1 hypothetical protein SR30_10640 [Brachyspira hyodysenteriae]TVL74084.1 hypothetical protein A9X77_12700 [Brachyspira hyodysenteriae]TVL85570.1 hypothetical protein A9X78_02445 [Brachyspira hyodysenteriae]